MDPEDAFRQKVPGVRASADPADRVAYARDLWPRHHLAVRAGNVAEHRPAFIVWPESTEDVQKIARWANESETPIVPFGAGSGVCAGILPTSRAVVIDLKKMTRWRAFDRTAPMLDVEAGHMGMPLEEKLDREGFTVGHFPSSILCSTVGGWVAARGAGQCSGRYGKIEDMVVALECVTGAGEIVTLHSRAHGPSLVPLVIGSEGTLCIITSATLRLHPRPEGRAFAAFGFSSTHAGWEGMRAIFQAGVRPAVCRLYDPFDAMLARMGSVKKKSAARDRKKTDAHAPGTGARALRTLLRIPGALNTIIDGLGGPALGGAMLVVIFEGEEHARDCARAREILGKMAAKYEGEGPARSWLQHRYAVSYRQAPVFEAGLFSDTMEIAAPWSKLEGLYESVRSALGKSVFVMAHLSHAYPDGCAIYFSFAGSAGKGDEGWDASCEAVYDRTWKTALTAAIDAGGTLAHHHGVGRSKAPRLAEELGGVGIDAVRAVMRAFDPKGIMNPGNLLPPPAPDPYVKSTLAKEIRA